MTGPEPSAGTRFVVRETTQQDDAALRAVAAACPMEGEISMCVLREPEFLALNKLEGDRSRVCVATVDGRVAGCAMIAERLAYVHGVPTRTLYSGDLKVHPDWRGTGVVDLLGRWCIDEGRVLAGEDAPMLFTVLAGNRPMESRERGERGAPFFSRFATVRALSIPLLWRRGARPDRGVRVTRATPREVEEMSALWSRVALTRQFAPALGTAAWHKWLTSTPSLSIGDYRIARGHDGRMLGFVGWWDQSSFKQLRVLRYSRRLGAVRSFINGIARVTGAPAVAAVGEQLRFRTACHVCVPADSPETLRALVLDACREYRAAQYPFITIGLDATDPLMPALHGLFAQPTDVGAYIMTPRGPYTGPSLMAAPLHYEIALV